MKSPSSALLSLALFFLLFASPVADASERLVPAGSLIQCTTEEPRLSSKTEAVGDPVLCQIGSGGSMHPIGTGVEPYDSYLVGRFEEYKDPGHFVGKGWMQLSFDRMVIEPQTVLPVNAKVVGVPGYRVDRQGRILGKGHPTRDTVEWMLPILWPIDLLNLPRRGPRPTLKTETRLTVKVMDDFMMPIGPALQQESPGLYRRAPSAYTPAPAEYAPQLRQISQAYYPLSDSTPGDELRLGPQENSMPVDKALVAPKNARMPYMGESTRNPVTIIFAGDRLAQRVYNFVITPTTLYVLDGQRRAIPLVNLDLEATRRVNLDAGVDFQVPKPAPSEAEQ